MSKKAGFTIKAIGKRFKQIKKKDSSSVKAKVKTKRILKYTALFIITFALMAIVYQKQQAGIWFKASILEAPQPFNGTVLPVSNVPNWITWGGDNHITKYSDVDPANLIDLPPYDLSMMAFPSEQLVWGNS